MLIVPEVIIAVIFLLAKTVETAVPFFTALSLLTKCSLAIYKMKELFRHTGKELFANLYLIKELKMVPIHSERKLIFSY